MKWVIALAAVLMLLTGCSSRQSGGTQIAFDAHQDTMLISTSNGFYTITTSGLFDYKKEFIFNKDSLAEIREIFVPHDGFDISQIGEYTDGDFEPTDLAAQDDGTYYYVTTSGADFEALSKMSRQQLYSQFEAALGVM